MTEDSSPALKISGVSKVFRPLGGTPVHAVRQLDLEIGRGEIVAFLGPNGAGKTTALDMVLGLTDPTTGTIGVFGHRPRAAVHEGRISAVLQSGGLLRDLSVRETVRVIASSFRQHRTVDEVIERSGLSRLATRRVGKLSGGEQQRLRFALALLPDPDLLILDEPTAGMDVAARHDFWATMKAEVAGGRTVLFATHYLEEADTFAQRTVLVARGEVVADGPTEQIRARASGRLVHATVAEHTRDWVVRTLRERTDVREVEVTGERMTIRTDDSDTVARLLLTEWGGHDLEVTTGSLDDAFLALTGEDAEGTKA